MSTDDSTRMLGLIGGLGVGATVSYYQALVEAHKAVGRIPRLLIAHANVDRVLSLVRDGHSRDLARYLGDLADRLQAAGAAIGAVAAVTPHLFFSEIAEASRLPLVNLVDELAREVRVRGARRIALFGTRFIMESSLLDGVGVEVVRPQATEVDRIHGCIWQLSVPVTAPRRSPRSCARSLCGCAIVTMSRPSCSRERSWRWRSMKRPRAFPRSIARDFTSPASCVGFSSHEGKGCFAKQ